MIRKDLLFGNRSLLIVGLLMLSLVSLGQKKTPKSAFESFLDTQFWLGIRVGVNYTQAFPDTRNTGFSPINYSADTVQKVYDDFSMPGAHMGLEMNFYHRGFSVSFQPAYKRTNYNYSSGFEWEGEQITSRFETTYSVEQRLDLLELPLMLKGDLIRKGKIRPFLMFGGFYSIVTSAQKDIDIRQVSYTSGTALASDAGSFAVGGRGAFQNFLGIGGGAGVNLDYWNIRTVFELNYKMSLSDVTKPNVLQNELASLGEVNDGITLRDINISLSFIFPFRFIDQQFKAY